MIEKYIREDGKVAVLYSPGFGAGWSTWNSKYSEFLLFDKGLVELVLNEQKDKIEEYIEKNCEYATDMYISTSNLQIKWMDQGTKFLVREYDGSEHIEYYSGIEYYTA
jgi:hypothetical protein